MNVRYVHETHRWAAAISQYTYSRDSNLGSAPCLVALVPEAVNQHRDNEALSWYTMSLNAPASLLCSACESCPKDVVLWSKV